LELSVQVGAIEQYTAIGHYNAGTTVDLSELATWSASDPTVVAVDTTGRATAQSAGTSTIHASFENVRSNDSMVTVTAP
jgi:uncharacterized protein YjdB